jgi:hypothetical protein
VSPRLRVPGAAASIPAMLGYGPIMPRLDEESLAHAGAALTRELRSLTQRLRGRRVLFLTRARKGDLASQSTGACVRMMRHLGVEAQWYFVEAAEDREALAAVDDRGRWLAASFRVACALPGGWDVGVGVGRELAGVAAAAADRARSWALACQYPDTGLDDDWLAVCVPALDRIVLDHPGPARGERVSFIAPALDPAAAANVELAPGEARRRCQELDLDPDRPLLCQIVGYDSWDPAEGLLGAYWRIKDALPKVQLALACPLPPRDDAERRLWRNLQAQASEDPDVRLINSGRPEHVNAVRSCADVVISGVSLPAFGLEAAEAKYKRKPVIARRGGSADAVIEHGVTGFLTETPADTAHRALTLLRDPRLAARLGAAGDARLRKTSLLPRLTRDWLRLLDQLAGAPPRGNAVSRPPARGGLPARG